MTASFRALAMWLALLRQVEVSPAATPPPVPLSMGVLWVLPPLVRVAAQTQVAAAGPVLVPILPLLLPLSLRKSFSLCVRLTPALPLMSLTLTFQQSR